MTLVDVLVLLVIAISAFVALLRGFSHEVLSLLRWVIAALITGGVLWLSGSTIDLLGAAAGPVKVMLAVGLFALLLVVLHRVKQRLLPDDRSEAMSGWDQVMGFVFGAARGVLVVAALFKAYLVIADGGAPQWARDARLYPVIAGTSNLLNAVVPGEITDRAASVAAPRPVPRTAPATRQPETVPRPVLRAPRPAGVTEPAASAADTGSQDGSDDETEGYSRDERNAIEQLLRNKLDSP